MVRAPLLWFVLLAACAGAAPSVPLTSPVRPDSDGDGWEDDVDCQPEDPSVYPGATEAVGDGIDEDCDAQELCYGDADGDGWRTDATVMSADLDCDDAGESGPAAPAGDCADDDPRVNPAAVEQVGDGIDEDCDGGELCYVDADRDGYRGDATVASVDPDCEDEGEAGDALQAGDCDDGEPTVFPGAAEVCEDGLVNDCNAPDGSVDATCPVNLDGITSVSTTGGDYVQVGDFSWQFASGRTRVDATEASRNDEGITLELETGDTVILDVAAMEVRAGDGSVEATIVEFSREVKGFNVGWIAYGGGPDGECTQTGSHWTCRDADGVVLDTFTERSEDEWSAYLTSQTTGGYAQIDLWLDRYTDIDGTQWPISDADRE